MKRKQKIDVSLDVLDWSEASLRGWSTSSVMSIRGRALIELASLLAISSGPRATMAQADDCPCTNQTSFHTAGTAASDTFIELVRPDASQTGEFVNAHRFRYPRDYGVGRCAAWDVGLGPHCNRSSTIPAFCTVPWCFVDLTRCRWSRQTIRKASILEPLELYYSYSTCAEGLGASAASQARVADQQFIEATTLSTALGTPEESGTTIRVGFPGSYYPDAFKRDSQGNPLLFSTSSPLIRDESIPWEGFFVDYFEALLAEARAAGYRLNVSYTSVSGAAVARRGSPWTAAVDDVDAGLIDLSPVAILLTEERLRMAPFTIRVTDTRMWLFVPRPTPGGNTGSDGRTFHDLFTIVFRPFSTSLWIAIVGAALLVGTLQVFGRIRLDEEDTAVGSAERCDATVNARETSSSLAARAEGGRSEEAMVQEQQQQQQQEDHLHHDHHHDRSRDHHDHHGHHDHRDWEHHSNTHVEHAASPAPRPADGSAFSAEKNHSHERHPDLTVGLQELTVMAARYERYVEHMWTGLFGTLQELMSGGAYIDVDNVNNSGGRVVYLGKLSPPSSSSILNTRARP